MAFAEELVTLFSSLGTFGSTIFIGEKTAIPSGDGPYLSIIETGGSGPQRIQNQLLPAYKYPTAQIVTRAKTYVAARTMAQSAWDLVASVRNQTVGGSWFRHMTPLQSEPFSGGVDDKDRPTVKFNVLGDKG